MPWSMENIALSNGEVIRLFAPAKEDAIRLIAYVRQVAGETDFLTFGRDEFDLSVKAEEQFIEDHRRAPNQLIVAAELDGTIVALLHLSASAKPRLRHQGEFGLTVLRDHWHKGIGTILMNHMLQWARATGIIRKINLKVLVHNLPAIALYHKFGFVVEGRLTRDALIGGTFYDIYLMGLPIDPDGKAAGRIMPPT